MNVNYNLTGCSGEAGNPPYHMIQVRVFGHIITADNRAKSMCHKT